MIKAILFDLFGTVIAYGDVAEGTRLAWEGIYAVLLEQGTAAPYDRFVPIWERLLGSVLPEDQDSAETPFLSKILRLFDALSVPRDLAAATRAAQACLRGWGEHVHLPSDTIPTLRTLRNEYRIALVSNFDHPPYVRDLLARMGLTHLFDAIVISGELRIDKPDPRIFGTALRNVDVAADAAIFVGDSIRADIEGARSAGCRPILIDRRDRYPEYPGLCIATLAELPPLVATISREP